MKEIHLRWSSQVHYDGSIFVDYFFHYRCHLQREFLAGLELHPFPAFLVDEKLRILGSNAIAKSSPKDNGLIRAASGRLKLGDSSLDARLRILATQAITANDTRALRIPNPRAGPAHWLLLCPISHSHNGLCTLLVSLRLWDDVRPLAGARIMQALGLTRAEAELSLALANGHCVQKIARETHRTVSTIRWHISNILRKADCEDQSELIRTIMLLSL